MRLDEDSLKSAEDELVDWGILERAPALQLTRRFRAAIMRAAAKLQAEEKAGAKRAGHPVEVSIAVALEEYPLPPGAAVRREHQMLLVGLQVASLPDAVRAFLGA